MIKGRNVELFSFPAHLGATDVLGVITEYAGAFEGDEIIRHWFCMFVFDDGYTFSKKAHKIVHDWLKGYYTR